MARRLLCLTIFVLGGACLAWGGSCETGSLAAYMAPGYTCTLGTLTFSNFSYTGTATNATPVSASQITIVPTGTSLLLQGPWTAGPGQSIDSVITYNVTGTGVILTGVDVSMLGY